MGLFGDALAAARQRKGLTAYRLAKITGIPQPSLSRLESGVRSPTIDVMKKLELAFANDEIEKLGNLRNLDVFSRQLFGEGKIPEPMIVAAVRVRLNELLSGVPVEEETLMAAMEEANRSPASHARIPIYDDISYGFEGLPGNEQEGGDFPWSIIAGASHAVRISGDNMLDMGFRSGTLLFIEANAVAVDGLPVIARIDGADYVCKGYRDSGRKRWIQGRSDAMKERIYFDQHDIEVMGVVRAWWGKSG